MPNVQQMPETHADGTRRVRAASLRAGRTRRVLVLSGPFPSVVDTGYGVFVKERVRAVADLPGYEVQVVSPIPYFPPLRHFPRWYQWSQFPREETVAGLNVRRPRFVLPPKVGGVVQPRLMYRSVCRCVDDLRRLFDFDLIDAHWVFPHGVLAGMLGRRYQRPVVMTGRGEDLRCFPSNRWMGPQIRRALESNAQLIAVSREIAGLMEENGADPRRISVIPNGVDCRKFQPQDRREARERVGLSAEGPLLVSVGELLELKGFHILAEAVGLLKDRWPDLRAVIIGRPGRFGRDYTPEIENTIRRTGLEDRVKLIGFRPHDELPLWYSAADLFVLLSSREGSPNVLMEALACGTPAVGTAVGGIQEVLEEERLGILAADRSPAAVAVALDRALSRAWDRSAIRRTMELRSWEQTAEAVSQVFERALVESGGGVRQIDGER